MLGRMLVIDSDVASRFALKARLGAANHQVQTAGDVAEAMLNCAGVSAVLLRNPDPAALARDIATLKRRLAVPVIAICDAVQRQAAFRAGAEYVLDGDCHDSVLRARLRGWMARPAEAEAGYRRVLSIAADDPDARRMLGLLAAQQGRAEEALSGASLAVDRPGDRFRWFPTIDLWGTGDFPNLWIC